jgi:hypothetical protein
MRRRATALLTLGCGLVAGRLGPALPNTLVRLGGNDFGAALEALAVLLLTAACTWAALVGSLALVAARATWAAALLRAVAPRAVRHAVLGGAVGAGLLVPGVASATSVDGLPYPDRPTGGTAQVDRPVVRARPPVAPAPHVVRPGETLWSIAADRLPARAGSADVARAVARWHAANRDVVDDPDLIHPGQRLRPPTKDTP